MGGGLGCGISAGIGTDEAHDFAFGAAADGAGMVQMGGKLCSPGQNEGCKAGEFFFKKIDLFFNPDGVGFADAWRF